MAATEFTELQSPLPISDSARAERLARQVERMAAHIEFREAAMQRTEARADHLERVTDALYSESRLLRERVSELEIAWEQAERAYRSILESKTMRWLSIPRALYARLLERRKSA